MNRVTDKGISTAEAAVHVLTGATGTGYRGGATLDEAVAMLEHIICPPAQWRRAVAYLACQLIGQRAVADADANLALIHIRRILDEHDERVRRAGGVT